MIKTILIILFIVFLLAYFRVNVTEIVNFFLSFVQFLINLVYSILHTITASAQTIPFVPEVPANI